MPSDRMLKTMNGIHRVILGVTRGKAGWTAGKMPVLELTTIGRKSGEPRSCLLTSPLQENGEIVIVASRGGDDHHPAWYLNLLETPQVQVSYKGAPHKIMTARTANSEERARMWPIVAGAYKGYAGYQEKTSREIPLVILSES
ncbi:MAG: nitroreductase [Acidimicrobiia bacterium BACL6 MAG-121220-bin61]|mgnify:FL=1|jgi:deazaflavin-dependent oxidoreductase (nitroreductase family)|uniref:Nitroreductase n=1 Tax=Acidimicrobiia bacterium BACL6 MAG-120924-bin43 TaxID=1655583 RepID=A0A0R2QF15_9ACTN|nr:MAG: nitroreductase [Acidimicrobiia bacterium BACL6 MAG-120924-bin43]KRO51673.1 MAG: nitroreductase [Acidimicrobiia bacterium BACL6 MAG-120910-bin40]KRO54564.1 MAG: nitroreductase [Acidimicrobiia bacterium BACL6 MAG-120322-bin79]KRO66093.1 MAG: nitroreductase [Acidimicrobiia bacterium BACL6 MAG-121220-bin61]HAG68237.1 nitroreductase family deazaflavin-dependent oxidoreductase [Acidimicrobium sp.]